MQGLDVGYIRTVHIYRYTYIYNISICIYIYSTPRVEPLAANFFWPFQNSANKESRQKLATTTSTPGVGLLVAIFLASSEVLYQQGNVVTSQQRVNDYNLDTRC